MIPVVECFVVFVAKKVTRLVDEEEVYVKISLPRCSDGGVSPGSGSHGSLIVLSPF